MINTLVNRARTICEADSLPAEIKHLKSALKKNGYEPKVVDRCLQRTRRDRHNEKPVATVRLPYIQGVTTKISSVLKKYKVRTVFNTAKSVGQCLRKVKDTLNLEDEGVYKIPCSCGKVYIGETGRNLSTRIKEHIRADKKGDIKASAVAEHTKESNHSVQYDGVKLLANVGRYWPRKVREAVEIFKHPNNLNRDKCYKLPDSWKPAIVET